MNLVAVLAFATMMKMGELCACRSVLISKTSPPTDRLSLRSHYNLSYSSWGEEGDPWHPVGPQSHLQGESDQPQCSGGRVSFLSLFFKTATNHGWGADRHVKWPTRQQDGSEAGFVNYLKLMTQSYLFCWSLNDFQKINNTTSFWISTMESLIETLNFL